jgi:hypothetical protein
MRRLLSVLGSIYAVSGAGVARADEPATPVRHRFTYEVGLGAGATSLTREFFPPGGFGGPGRSTVTSFHPTFAVSASAGVFLTEEVALLLRLSAPTYEDGGWWVASFAGPAVQVWLADEWVVGAGVGLGAKIPNEFGQNNFAVWEFGTAFSARASYVLRPETNGVWRLGVEVVPIFYEGLRTISVAVCGEWQGW